MLHSGSHNVDTLNVALLSVVRLNVIMLSIVMLNVNIICIVMLSAVLLVVCMQYFVMLCFGIVMLIVFKEFPHTNYCYTVCISTQFRYNACFILVVVALLPLLAT